MSIQSPLELLTRSNYVLLTTFRRDGTPVPTPVWVARVDDELVIWTNPAAGKVKRIRRNPQVEIGPCSRGGRPLGRSIGGSARVLAPAELGVVMPALIRKYGLIARLTQVPSRFKVLLGRPPLPSGGIAVTVHEGFAGMD